jgi:hypothetical protein
MKLNTNIAISDTGFIFNPATGDSFSTNNVGLEIIRLLKEEKKKEDIILNIREKFSVDETSLDKDLVDFLMMLNNYQLLKEEDE